MESKVFGEYSQPFTRDFDRLRSKITPQKCKFLLDNGYVVIDNCFGLAWARALLEEMQYLNAQGLMQPNKTQFSSMQTTSTGQSKPVVHQFVKPNIYEVDLHDDNLRSRVPELDALFHSNTFIEILAQHVPQLELINGTGARTLKLQRNAGHGGCFPCHYDNPGKPNKRKLTCLLYLNEHWKPGDGGEVQLVPFLKTPVTVAPKMDRVVMFMSDWMLHRVLPSNAERYCLTVWVDGSDVNTDEDTQLRISASDLANWDEFMDKLRRSPVQRLLSRGVYEEEYYESLVQCMQHAPQGFIEMLSSHEAHVEKLRQNIPLYSFISRLRAQRDLNVAAVAEPQQQHKDDARPS